MSLITQLKTLVLLSLLLLTSFSFATEESKMDSQTESNEYTIYVTVDQIVLLNEGIFVNVDHLGLIPVRSVTWLQDGLCLVMTYEDPKCRHLVYCPKCSGCHPGNTCQFRCKCEPRRP